MKKIAVIAGLGLLATLAIAGFAAAGADFGQTVEGLIEAQSEQQFGLVHGLDVSSFASIDAATANADPTKLATLAAPLQARVLTTTVGVNSDQMAFWPNDNSPEWLIACNEEGPTRPGLQRIRLSDGHVDTIVTGTSACDPVRRTPWATILFGEEAGGGATGGRMYELINPVDTTGVTLDRTTGLFSGGVHPENLVKREALGRLSFEGLAIYPNGIVYYGDENRPNNGTAGGAYFKFIPGAPPGPNAGTNLSQSPLVGGAIYGLRLGVRVMGTGHDFGEGSETGLGAWILVANTPNADLRALAAANKLTGYYRPEDAEIDTNAQAAGNVRFCGTNTGNEGDDHNFGEIICITDGSLGQALANTALPAVQRLVEGNPEFAMPDNVAFKPAGRQFWVFHEDGDMLTGNNDLWACLDDGADADLMADACLRIATLNDLTAEWTGGIFDAAAKHFYVSVQHNISGHGVILDITGWK